LTAFNYETCVILNPNLDEPDLQTLVEKLKQQLIQGGAEVFDQSMWGLRKLAFDIGKFTDGYYVVFFYRLPQVGDTISDFNRTCRYDENVLRAMTIKAPVKKYGTEVQPLVPEPGFLAGFSMKLKPALPRRAGDFGPRRGEPSRSRYAGPKDEEQDDSGGEDESDEKSTDKTEDSEDDADKPTE
jgi:small subunit ribosomal protein S6